VFAYKVRRKVMYLANEEKPTAHLRLQTKWYNGHTSASFIQQKWIVRENYKTRYEWRMLPSVDDSAPDIEPYDENLCD
jgi:hypothetical protein